MHLGGREGVIEGGKEGWREGAIEGEKEGGREMDGGKEGGKIMFSEGVMVSC